MSVKKHYKLYKAGKQWCVAAIATVAMIAGLTGVASADDATSANNAGTLTTQKVTTSDNTTVTNDQIDAQNNQDVKNVSADQPTEQVNDSSQGTTNQVNTTRQSITTESTKSRVAATSAINLPTGRPGWSQQNGTWYYFNNSGTASTGWQRLGGWYYFNPYNGQMQTGLQSINNKYYYLNVNHDGTFGAMQSGWQRINGQWYGFGGPNDGAAYTGWHYINNRWYYFRQDGQALSNWQRINNNWYYFDNQNAWALTGWQRINNNWYYFDSQNAWALKAWQYINNNWYYFDPTNAWALTGWQRINNNWYYFDNQNAWALRNWQRINNNWYYFDPTNVWAQKGWFQTQAGNWYYFDPANAWALTGWQRINNNWYYFDNQNAWALKGWQYINHNWYYFDPVNVWAHKGWLTTPSGNKYYFDPANAWAVRGLQRLSDHLYYFDQNGQAQTGWQYINNRWYYFDLTNLWAYTGWLTTPSGYKYYFDPTNAWAVRGLQKLSDHLYYFDQNGQAQTGWQHINNQWYYFDPTNIWAASGWQKINGDWYHFNDQNVWIAASGWQWINNDLYYLDQNGHPSANQSFDYNGMTLRTNNDGIVVNFNRDVRENIAQKIATEISQQRQNTVLYDWTNQEHNYQEFALHDTAQLLAQGDAANDKTVLESLLEKNDLLNGEVVATQVFDSDLQNLNINNVAQHFIAGLPTGNLNNTVLGVGYDTANNRFAIILFRPGKSALQTATSRLSAIASQVYKNQGVNVDVLGGLHDGAVIDSNDLGDVLAKVSPTLLKGEAGTEISQDVLKTIFAGLPGNITAIEGTKNYYYNNDAYHYQFWLTGQSAADKLANFLALNKGVKYGDQLKVNYTATLFYGPEKGTVTPAINETPASKKTAQEIELAYQKGTESGAQYDGVKVEPIAGMKQDTIRGVDISSYLALVQNGVQFYDFNGQPASLMKVLADAGVNYVRLRLWVDPYNAQGLTYGGGNDDEATVLEIAREAKQYGMKVLLAMHYSDFWADPAVQLRPKQWMNLNDADLNEELYLYTKKIANDFNQAGANIDMAQMGNEITAGFLGLRKGWGVWTDPTDSARLTGYLKSISRAFREESPSTQLAIHIETPDYNRYDAIMGAMQSHGVDYDVLASSYYPFWGTWNNNTTNIKNIEKMAKDKYGKKFVIAETGWPFTLQNSDGTPNNISSVPANLYPVGPQGQVDELADAYKAVLSNDNGLGVFYWEPTWIPVKAGWDNWEYNRRMGDVAGTGWASINSRGYYPDSKIMWQGKPASGGSSWDNNTFFDDNGHPLQSLQMYNGFLHGYQSKDNVASDLSAKLTVVDNNGIQLTNPLSVGTSLKTSDVLGQTSQQYLNGIAGTSISQSSLVALFNGLQDGFKSTTYTDALGNKYHYEFWLVGNNATEKLNNFLTLNQGALYGNPLQVNYRATLVANPADDQITTSPVNVTLSDAYGLTGVTIDNPLKVNDKMPATDLAKIQTAVNSVLTGEKGTVINTQTFKNLANVLPGVYGSTGAMVGTKVYTLPDGNQYHYEYWLTTKDLQAANQGAKYGEPINLTYSASLKWIDPKAN